MSNYQQPCHPSHGELSSRDDRRTLSRGRAYSSSDSSARLLPTTHPRSKISGSQTCKIPVNPNQMMIPDGIDSALLVGNNEIRPPGTPVPVPSLSSSKDVSPQSSGRRSPITPTFIDNHHEDNPLSGSSSLKPRPLKPNREVEKRNISYPMSNPAYSTIPLTLDIRVDRDAYEPRREPPRPVDPLPRDLETSYLEWDETSSKLDKVKKSMRLVGHGHRKQATPIIFDTLPHRSPDRCINATPRTSPHSRHLPVTVNRHRYQERPSNVSNFSKPAFQSSNIEKWSKHPASGRTQAASPQMCDWQEFLRSSMPIQEMCRPQEPSPILERVKDKYEDDILYSQQSASVSRHVNGSPPLITGNADAGTKIAGRQALAKVDTGTKLFAAHDRNPHPQTPSFYTYHVTRRIDTANMMISSYTYPQNDDTVPLSPSREPNSNVLDASSRHNEDENGTTKNRSFKNIVQGMTKKPSMSTLRRRGTHSRTQR